ncbi:MAG: protease inhibitor I42 family protein, partial [Steroidobacteraceae bacterium]
APGCSPMPDKPLTVAEPVPLQLEQGAHGSTVELRPGQELRITLPSNPSTGYAWRVAPAGLPSVLVLQGDPVYARVTGEARVGAPGKQSFSLRAAQPGRGSLRIEYVRPWEPQAVAGDFTLEAVVEP